jgi:hypothetical protein
MRFKRSKIVVRYLTECLSIFLKIHFGEMVSSGLLYNGEPFVHLDIHPDESFSSALLHPLLVDFSKKYLFGGYSVKCTDCFGVLYSFDIVYNEK